MSTDRDERPVCDLVSALGDVILTRYIVKIALHNVRLFGRALEFLAQADRCVTYADLLTVARRFVVVRDIPKDGYARQ
jgi:hypothetical protein